MSAWKGGYSRSTGIELLCNFPLLYSRHLLTHKWLKQFSQIHWGSPFHRKALNINYLSSLNNWWRVTVTLSSKVEGCWQYSLLIISIGKLKSHFLQKVFPSDRVLLHKASTLWASIPWIITSLHSGQCVLNWKGRDCMLSHVYIPTVLSIIPSTKGHSLKPIRRMLMIAIWREACLCLKYMWYWVGALCSLQNKKWRNTAKQYNPHYVVCELAH